MALQTTTSTTKAKHLSIFSGRELTPELFWDSLGSLEKEKSVNPDISRPIGKKTGWDVQGKVQDHWNKQLSSRIRRLETKFGKPDAWGTTVEPYMRGSSIILAVPTIVITCWDENVAKKLRHVIQMDPLVQASGFEVFCWQGSLGGVASENPASVVPKTSQGFDIAGLRVTARLFSGEVRQATIGGVIFMEGGELFGLTAAHVFRSGELQWAVQGDKIVQEEQPPQTTVKMPVIGSDKENETDQKTDKTHENNEKRYGYFEFEHNEKLDIEAENSMGDTVTGTEPTYRLVNGSISVEEEGCEGAAKELGSFQSFPRLLAFPCDFANTELDWALVSLSFTLTKSINQFISRGRLVKISSEIADDFDGAVDVVTHGLAEQTECSKTVSITRLPWALQSVRLYTLIDVAEQGSCGTLVLDRGNHKAIGMIIATQPQLRKTYLAPMRDVFRDISKSWDGRTVVFTNSTIIEDPPSTANNRNYVIYEDGLFESEEEKKAAASPSGPKKDIFPKIRRKDIALETLQYYDIKWKYDEMDSDYIIIQQAMSQRETDVLFKHTDKLRKERKENPRAIEGMKEGGSTLFGPSRTPKGSGGGASSTRKESIVEEQIGRRR